MESCYSYEETGASVAEGLHLESVEHYFKEDDTENLPEHALKCKGDDSPITVANHNTPVVEPQVPDAPGATSHKASEPPKTKHPHCHNRPCSNLPDIKKLKFAIPVTPNHGYFTACYRCAQENCVR